WSAACISALEPVDPVESVVSRNGAANAAAGISRKSFSSGTELLIQPRLGLRPVALDGALGDSKDGTGLGVGEPAKKPALHHTRAPRLAFGGGLSVRGRRPPRVRRFRAAGLRLTSRPRVRLPASPSVSGVRNRQGCVA